MSKYKAVFIDLDGTLLNSKKTISQRSINCVNKLIAEGVLVFIATGRTIQSTRRVTGELNLTTQVITLNGANIQSSMQGHTMSASFFAEENVLFLSAICKKLLNTDNPLGLKNIIVDTIDSAYTLKHDATVSEFSEHYAEPPKDLDLDNPPLETVMTFLFLADDRLLLLKTLEEQLQQRLNVCQFNGWHWIEVTPLGVNKAVAMELLCAEYNITLDEVVAFGDGANDKEMLKQAGLGVAMANADSFARAAAKVTTLTNDDDGVAVFLEQLKRDNLI